MAAGGDEAARLIWSFCEWKMWCVQHTLFPMMKTLEAFHVQVHPKLLQIIRHYPVVHC